MRRYLYLLAVVLVVAIVVLAGILIARRAGPGTTPIDSGGGTTTPGGLPVAPPSGGDGSAPGTPGGPETTTNYEGQKFSVVAENKAIDFFTNKDGSVVLVQPDGQIMKVQGGQVLQLSSSIVADLINTSFSYDGKEILAVFGDRLNPETSIFDVTSKTWSPLPPKILSPSWSPINHQIAYLGERNGSGVVFTLDTSKVNAVPQEIIKINAQDIKLEWIAQNQIVLSDKGSAWTKGSVWGLNIKDKTLTPFLAENSGLDSVWGTDYGLAFASNQNLRGGALTLYGATGNPLHEMSFFTLPSKCVFNTETATMPAKTTSTKEAPIIETTKMLYCAIPKNAEAWGAAILPDSYFKKELFTSDEFYGVDLSDGKTDVISIGNTSAVDAINLKVFNNALFFINRLDEKLYASSLR